MVITWLLKKNKYLKTIFEKIKKDYLNTYTKLSHQQEQLIASAGQIDNKVSKKEFEQLKNTTAKLEGSIAVLLKSQSQQVSVGLNKSQNKIETQIINKVRRSKKSFVIAEINKLTPSHSIIEIFDIIVRNKGLCSKASFYRYIAGLKSLKVNETETETNFIKIKEGGN